MRSWESVRPPQPRDGVPRSHHEMDASRGSGRARVEVETSTKGETSERRVTTIGLDMAQDWRVVAPGQARVSGARRRRRGPDRAHAARRALGRARLKKRLARGKVLALFANLPRHVIGLEACGGAHD